jgi:hypothetical protein
MRSVIALLAVVTLGLMKDAASQELTGEEGRLQAISVALGHVAILDSWRRGDVLIVRDQHYDSSSDGVGGEYREERVVHRLIFDRDRDRYYYVRLGKMRFATIDDQAKMTPHDSTDQLAVIIDGPNRMVQVRHGFETPLRNAIFDSVESLLDKYKVPIVWAIGNRAFGEAGGVTVKSAAAEFQSAASGTFHSSADVGDRFSITRFLENKHGKGEVIQSVQLDQRTGYPSDFLTRVFLEKDGKRGLLGEYHENYEWEQSANGEEAPAKTLCTKERLDGSRGIKFTETIIHKLHWNSFNMPLDDKLFDPAHIHDFDYLTKSLDLSLVK